MKVRDLLHTSRDVPWSWGTTGITVGLFFVVIIAQDKAEQKTWHHNISDPQHREVAACGTREQLKLGSRPRHKVTSPGLLHFGFELHFAHPFFLPAGFYVVEAKGRVQKTFSWVISPPPHLSFKHTHFDSNDMLLQTSLFLPVVFKLLLLLTHSVKQTHQLSISIFSLLSVDGRYHFIKLIIRDRHCTFIPVYIDHLWYKAITQFMDFSDLCPYSEKTCRKL